MKTVRRSHDFPPKRENNRPATALAATAPDGHCRCWLLAGAVDDAAVGAAGDAPQADAVADVGHSGLVTGQHGVRLIGAVGGRISKLESEAHVAEPRALLDGQADAVRSPGAGGHG